MSEWAVEQNAPFPLAILLPSRHHDLLLNRIVPAQHLVDIRTHEVLAVTFRLLEVVQSCGLKINHLACINDVLGCQVQQRRLQFLLYVGAYFLVVAHQSKPVVCETALKSGAMPPKLVSFLVMLLHHQMLDWYEVQPRIQQLWTFVWLDMVWIEDVISELAYCLEIDWGLGHKLMKVFFLKFIGQEKLLAESWKVDSPTQ